MMKWISGLWNNRIIPFSILILMMFSSVLYRFYDLQVVKGGQFREEFEDRITREEKIPGSRGIIYDRNGVELAYNELSYSVSIADNGTYERKKERNDALNGIIADAIQLLEDNAASVKTYLPIEYSEAGGYTFTIEGTALPRFRADVFGYADTESLKYNERLGYHEAEADAVQIIEYLCSDTRYGVAPDFAGQRALQVVSIRYAMGENSYRRYLPVVMAEGINENAMTAIAEHQGTLPGVRIDTDMRRQYHDSKYFAHILGYTGVISEAELAEFEAGDLGYGRNDKVGKTGIEQALEAELRAKDGKTVFTVDHVGRVTNLLETEAASAGNDIYLTIDSELQKTIYALLEQKLAGILLANLVPERTEGTSGITITTNDVAGALLDNRVVDIALFESAAAGSAGKQLDEAFQRELTQFEAQFQTMLTIPYGLLTERQQREADYILQRLSGEGAAPAEETAALWQQGELSLEVYLRQGLADGWIQGRDSDNERYSELDEKLAALTDWLLAELPAETDFHRMLYLDMLEQGQIDAVQICMILFEQGVLFDSDGTYEALNQGTVPAYDFLREKIRNLEITPAQLALDPCTASSVVVDPDTGEVLASVTYPGYDNNRLSNTIDSAYYNRLLADQSLPLYNNATQQRTAPGSIFKLVTVAAGLTSGLIAEDTIIEDHGIFDEITPSPRCWIYPMGGATHGALTVTEAIRDSCNYFFYQIGYDFSLENEDYMPEKGIEVLQTYTELFGLNENSGIELAESTPQMADEFPVTAAIGQSNHNYTTTQLARYTAVLANQGSLYDLTFVKQIQNNATGATMVKAPVLKRNLDEILPASWNVISDGMVMMAENNRQLGGLSVPVAGKTGTAQQNRNRPNHALFIGYAPYQQPQIAVATRIAYGYASSNAVEVTADIFKYYFGLETVDHLVTGQASLSGNRGNVMVD